VQTVRHHAGPVWTVAVSAGGEFIATGGQDSIVRVYALMGSPAAKELDEKLRIAKAHQEMTNPPPMPGQGPIGGAAAAHAAAQAAAAAQQAGNIEVTMVNGGSGTAAAGGSGSGNTSGSATGSSTPTASAGGGAPHIPGLDPSLASTPIDVPDFDADFPLESGTRPIVYPVALRSYAGHKADVIDLNWSKANFLLSASIDKTVRLWHVSRQKCLCVFQHADFVTAVCFPEEQTRVLTSRGMLFLDEIEAQLAADAEAAAAAASSAGAATAQRPHQPLLFASLDTKTQQVVYGPGKLVFPERPPSHLVDFSTRASRKRWDARTSDDYGRSGSSKEQDDEEEDANDLSLLVTPEHRMYVQLGDESLDRTSSGEMKPKVHLRKDASGADVPFGTVMARELAPSACRCGGERLPQQQEEQGCFVHEGSRSSASRASKTRPVMLMQVSAPNGFTPRERDVLSVAPASCEDANCDLPVQQLGLNSEEALDAFLELYGYWLGAGAPSAAGSCPSFPAAQKVHLERVTQLLLRAGLQEGEGFAVREEQLEQQPQQQRRSQRRVQERRGAHKEASFQVLVHDAHWKAYFARSADSVQRFMPWVLQRLEQRQVRLLLEGLQEASSAMASATRAAQRLHPEERCIVTPSEPFREELQRACIHAGYSSRFYRVSTGAQVEWAVAFSERITERIPFADVVFDGQQHAKSEPEAPSCPYSAKEHGRLWCVQVEHPDHLLVAQRAHRVRAEDDDAAVAPEHHAKAQSRWVVTKASRPMVVGNCFHPVEDRYFVSGSFDKKLRIWNIPEHRVVEWAQTANIITAACFSPSGHMAVAGLYNASVVFYQTDGLKYFTQVDAKNRKGRTAKGKKVTGMQFSPHDGGRTLLVTTNDSRVRLYDMADYSMIAKFKGVENDELQIRAWFSPDGKQVICGGENQQVVVWSAAEYVGAGGGAGAGAEAAAAGQPSGASGLLSPGSSTSSLGSAASGMSPPPSSSPPVGSGASSKEKEKDKEKEKESAKPDVKCDSFESFRAFGDTCTSAQFLPAASIRLSADTIDGGGAGGAGAAGGAPQLPRHIIVAAGYQGEMKFFENRGPRKAT